MKRDFLVPPAVVTIETSNSGDQHRSLPGKTLHTLLGGFVHERLARLVLIPACRGIFWALGPTGENAVEIPPAGLDLVVNQIRASNLQFWCDTASQLAVLQFA